MIATAVAVIAGLQFILYKTSLGRSFRATSDDTEIAMLMGLDNRKVYASAMALCLAVVALADVFLGIRSNFDPFMGTGRLIFGFETVIIGGLGNLWGTLLGGVILGMAQGIGAEIDPGWQLLFGHLAFLLVLALRPRGLFPRMRVSRSTPASRISAIAAAIITALLVATPWLNSIATERLIDEFMAYLALAIIIMLVAPKGIWGFVKSRYNISLFPTGYRVETKE